MRQRLLFLALLLLFQAASLDAQSPENFFPSEVGNMWKYYRFGSPYLYDWKIVDDSVNYMGSRLLLTEWPSGLRGWRYLIDTTNNVFENPGTNSEKHAYKLDADSGETWVCYVDSAWGNYWA